MGSGKIPAGAVLAPFYGDALRCERSPLIIVVVIDDPPGPRMGAHIKSNLNQSKFCTNLETEFFAPVQSDL